MNIWPVELKYLSDAEIKQIRLSRKEMGLFFGASCPNRYIHNLVKRNPRLPSGRIQSVNAADGKQYKALTYSFSEIYSFALVSALPEAKAFLKDYSVRLSRRFGSRQFKEKPLEKTSFFTRIFLRIKPFVKSFLKKSAVHY